MLHYIKRLSSSHSRCFRRGSHVFHTNRSCFCSLYFSFILNFNNEKSSRYQQSMYPNGQHLAGASTYTLSPISSHILSTSSRSTSLPLRFMACSDSSGTSSDHHSDSLGAAFFTGSSFTLLLESSPEHRNTVFTREAVGFMLFLQTQKQ